MAGDSDLVHLRASIQAYLEASGANPNCPSCGSNSWSIVSPRAAGSLELPLRDHKTLNYDGGLPVAVLACDRCSFIRMHSLPPMELWLARDLENKMKGQG